MPLIRTCAVCKLAKQRLEGMNPVPDVQRYSLYRREPIHRGGLKTTQRGYGGIDLCGDCYKEYCAPNLRRRKAKNGTHSVV